MDNFHDTYQRWLQHDDLPTELRRDLEGLSAAEIEERFYRHLEFGTAGLRGLLGAGTNRMNVYTVRLATEALARYLTHHVQDAKSKGVAIAYDCRHQSQAFAWETACLLAANGFKTYLYEELRPTPMLSFAVRHYQAAGGVMITASHNPAAYNGYKVYDEQGCQISPYVAELVLGEMDEIEDMLSLPTMSREEALQRELIQVLGAETDRAYADQLHALVLNREAIQHAQADVRIVFTPLHGTGNKPIRQILDELGFTNVHVVAEQEQPDPNFSTVKSPNPEERQAFALALQVAEPINGDLIIGTDPDADRLGVIIRQQNGDYLALNGNQIGAMLLHYLLEQRHAKGQLPANGVVIKSIVTSELGRRIAESYGIECQDVLTGFKFIGEKIEEYGQTGAHTFLFGYEESYGYLVGPFVRDKDAVQAAMVACEMAAYYKLQGLALEDVLEQVYQQHGYHLEDQQSFTFAGKAGQEKIARMMAELRANPIRELGALPVADAQDYQQGLHGMPPANVLKYVFTDTSWIAIRPSGTEPKIKFYYSAVDPDRSRAEAKLAQLKADMAALIETL